MLQLISRYGKSAFSIGSQADKVKEEMHRPEVDVPRAMIGAISIGLTTAFLFLIGSLFCINNIDEASERLKFLVMKNWLSTRWYTLQLVFPSSSSSIRQLVAKLQQLLLLSSYGLRFSSLRSRKKYGDLDKSLSMLTLIEQLRLLGGPLGPSDVIMDCLSPHISASSTVLQNFLYGRLYYQSSFRFSMERFTLRQPPRSNHSSGHAS